MQNKSLRLKATPVRMVTKESDLDVAVEERTLRLPAVIFRNAVGLAEALSRFRAQPRHYFPAQSAALAQTLTDWLANQEEMSFWPPTRGITPLKHLGEFFAIPGNQRWLEKLVAFVAASNGFVVDD